MTRGSQPLNRVKKSVCDLLEYMTAEGKWTDMDAAKQVLWLVNETADEWCKTKAARQVTCRVCGCALVDDIEERAGICGLCHFKAKVKR